MNIYPGNERKKIFYLMSKAKYPSVDKMIKLHRQKKLKQKRKTTNPISIEIPPASFEDIPHVPLTLVGAFQQGPSEGLFGGVEESKAQEVEEVAIARVVEGLEGLTMNDKGKLYNPHSKRYIENTPANIKKIRAPPVTPKQTKRTPSSPAEQKSQQREKKRGRV
jgi:hypothetical protein